ncbi:MAG: 2-oxo acid dehydrogenase subunit E2, partial [Candidatus Bathyarchaeia archaeon]
YPLLNASMDDRTSEIILKKYYNIGIAVDTAEGLIVPVLKDADHKTLFQLATEIDDLSKRAREGELKIEDIRGGTFTITNIGSVGGLMGTPMVNYPEAAILAPFKIQKRPIVVDGEVRLRDMTYLSLSFDHRILDGAMAARFMNELIATLADRQQLLSRIE